jgi:hypothetical protein
VFYRAIVGLTGYEKARASGEKYSEALKAGIAAVRQEIPHMPMSETELKRVLAEFRSDTLESTLLVTESDNTVTPEGRKCTKAWALCIGPPPLYPRHNARQDSHPKALDK